MTAIVIKLHELGSIQWAFKEAYSLKANTGTRREEKCFNLIPWQPKLATFQRANT